MSALIPINLSSLKRAADGRPEGYYQAVLESGTIDGERVWLAPEKYSELSQRFSPRGLGDQVARIAKPIARAVDAVFGTDIEHCPSCKARQEWMNDHLHTP